MKPILGLSGLLAAALFAAGVPAQAEVKNGQTAPDFTLTDSNGKSQSLADYKGKIVVLEWVNHDCPFVKKHYGSGNMQKLQKEWVDKGVVWLTINSSAPGKQGHLDGAKANAVVKEKNAAPSAVLLDPDGKVGKLYNAQTTPHMYIIDKEGLLVYQGAIDSKPSTDAADIPNSENYVSAALTEVSAGKPVSKAVTKAYGCSVKYQ